MCNKVLVIGSGGMLGHVVTLYLRAKGVSVDDISKTRAISSNTILLDILDETALKDFLKEKKYSAVINCTALLLAASEQNKTQAILLNTYFPHWLEQYYNNTDTQVIQVSTDGVFCGISAPYCEYDYSDSVTFYGKTKYLGELHNEKDITIRSAFWGPDISANGIGIFNWFMCQDKAVSGYANVYFNGVSSLEFAKCVFYLLTHHRSGIFHLGIPEPISKYHLLKTISSVFGRNIAIQETFLPQNNNILENTRKDIAFSSKCLQKSVEELHEWIREYRQFYPHLSL